MRKLTQTLLAFLLLVSGFVFGQSPGGISSGLIFWLKADAGTNTTINGQTVTSWADQTANGNDATSGDMPTYVRPSLNYNASIYLDGASRFVMGNNGNINTSLFTQKSYSIVFKTGGDITTRQLLYEEGGGTHGLNLYIENGLLYSNLWVSSADNAGSVSIDTLSEYIFTYVYNGSSGRWDAYLNGSLASTDLSAPGNLPAHSGGIGIGAINGATQYNGNNDVGSGDNFTGHIMEMAYYTAKALSTTERQKVESYLAIKYAITLSGDYYAGGGSTKVWDATANSGYNIRVTGIGYQTNSSLNQKQSGSELSERLLSIGLGSIASDNPSNSNSFVANNTFMLWGDNGGDLTFRTGGAPLGYFAIDRKWKVEETGTQGLVRVQVPGEGAVSSITVGEVDTLLLLVDADGDFSTGALPVPMTKVGNLWEVDYDFADGQFFTFAVEGAIVSAKTDGSEAGPINIEYQLKLPGANLTGAVVTFDIADLGSGSATSGRDYSAIGPGAQFVVPSGDSIATFSVVVLDDVRIESAETVIIYASNSSSPLYRIGKSQGQALILDNDTLNGAGLVPGAVFWLRADDSTSTTVNGAGVNTWNDISGNGNNATAVGSQPLYADVVANFNPAIDFFSTSGGYIMADKTEINLGISGAKVLVMAFRTDSDINTLQTIYEEGGSVNGINLYIESGFLKMNWWTNAGEFDGATSIAANELYFVSFHYNGYSNRWDFYINGDLKLSRTGLPATLPAHSGDIGIGSIQNDTQFDGDRDIASGTTFLGDIMEGIYYNEKILTDNERGQLERYLSLKYGIPYSGNYLSSDSSTVVWNTLKNPGFSNNVAGISEDSQSQFIQKQSSAETKGSILTIGLGSIEVDNNSNNAHFSTGFDYLVWGDNGKQLTGTDNIDEIPTQSGMTDRLQRVWKVYETGAVGTVKMAFPRDSINGKMLFATYGPVYLRVADNDSLNRNPVDLPLMVENVNGVSSYTVDYDFSDSAYFSFIQKDCIVWDGTDWRGGLSALVPHGPSDDPLDSAKPMYIMRGDTALLTEAIKVDSTSVDSAAALQMNPQSCLWSNNISNKGHFILRADSSGFAQYNGPAVAATFEQFIDDAGWHLIGSPFSDVTWNDIKFKDTNTVLNHPLGGSSLDSCNYCNLWWYDASVDNGNDIGFASSDAFGTWRSSVDTNESFAPNKGWNLWLDEFHGFGSAPWTVSLSGTFNDGSFTQSVNENNAGWNLMANPYPSALDWDVVDDDLAGAGIAAGYHIWDHENTNYAVYGGGSGTLGLTQYVAPFQGFYVQTSTVGAQNSGDVFHDFDLENTDRPKVCTGNLGNFYKSGKDQEIVIRTRHNGSGKKDETVIVLSEMASRDLYSDEDIRKLFTPYKDAPSLFSRIDLQNLAIASIPPPVVSDSVQIGTICRDGSVLTIEAVKAPAGYTLYLEDIKTGKWHRIDQQPYTFTQDTRLANRFWLHFGPGSIDAKPWNADNPFSIFVRNDNLVIKTLKSISSATWYLTSVGGQVVLEGKIVEGEGTEHEAYIGHLSSGTYVLMMRTYDGYFAEKIVIL